MNNEKHFRPRHLALALVLPLALAACGGEETSTVVYNSMPAPTTHLTRSGTILPRALAGDALICLDLTGTGVCDASAATATRPRDDGSYVIRYEPKDAADAENFKTAALLAKISGEQDSYTLSSPGKKSNNINPLTTLVHRQMLQARTLEAAEQEVARRLDIDVDAIYEPRTSSVALAAVRLTNYSLKNGLATMIHSAPEAQDNSPRLVSFKFKDVDNYEFDVHAPEGSANDAGQTLWRPVYGGKTSGNDRTLENAAYTAISIDGFISTGREEYLKNGVLNLFSATNQFTPILEKQAPIAQKIQTATAPMEHGFSIETTVKKENISGKNMQEFFENPASYQLQLKDSVHLNSFKIEDFNHLKNVVFPEGSVLHIQLSTPIGNKNAIRYSPIRHVSNLVRIATKTECFWAETLAQQENDLNPKPDAHSTRALVVKYALNDSAWTAIKAALNLP